MVFSIRRAALGDEALLRELRIAALTDSPRAFSSTLDRELARTTEDWKKWFAPGVTFVLEADGQARGLVAGMRDAKDAAVVQLMSMWVHPGLRGMGAAARLVASVQGWAEELGATQLRLDVVENNVRAQRCYERAGFRVTGKQGVVEKSGDVEIEMVWEVAKRNES
ncbi:MAG: GNAT family N-acetyltransferase [Candidatus Acidiferrales bacterium]